MHRRVSVLVVAFSLAIGMWGFLYGLTRRLEPDPLAAQVYPEVTPAPQPTAVPVENALRYDLLVEQVAPLTGTTIVVEWGDMGQRLIDAGAIDLDKFEAQYRGLDEEQQSILLGDELDEITFKPENIQFWTNVLWALGLTQESSVLSEGPMMQNEAQVPLGNYASTGGWTLGSKPATELYSSLRLVELTPEQEALIYRVAEHIFRPCCGNHTAFPDCNHGMAVLGLLELLAFQGAEESELYDAALAFNAYAFTDSYVRVAAYFTLQGIAWSDIGAADLLGYDYSSIQGAQRIAAAVGPISGAPGGGGSCAA